MYLQGISKPSIILIICGSKAQGLATPAHAHPQYCLTVRDLGLLGRGNELPVSVCGRNGTGIQPVGAYEATHQGVACQGVVVKRFSRGGKGGGVVSFRVTT